MKRIHRMFFIRAKNTIFRFVCRGMVCFVVFLAVSCASQPPAVPDVPPDSADITESVQDEDNSSDDGILSAEEDAASDGENAETDGNVSESDENAPSLESEDEPDIEFERVQPEELPELPVIEAEIDEPHEEDTVPVIVEPEVQDVEGEAENEVPPETSGENELFSEPDDSDGEEAEGNEDGDSVDIDEEISDEENGISVEDEAESDIEETADAAPVPSRSLTVKRNQQIDVVYPGKGWVYQENIDEDGNHDVRSRNFIFGGRKLGGENQSFTLRSRVPGRFLLHFYKNDTLTGTYIDDYLEVIVTDESAEKDDAHVVAPDYASVVPPKAKITAETVKAAEKALSEKKKAASENVENGGNSGSAALSVASEKTERSSAETSSAVLSAEEAGARTVVQTTESKPDEYAPSVNTPRRKTSSQSASSDKKSGGAIEPAVPADADSLLKSARSLYEKKQYPQAFEMIQQFFDTAAEKIDEGLYLQGQILEAKSDVQNIKGAVDSYDLLMKNYPTSRLWNDAKKRSVYLKRFYLNIR